MKTVIVYESMFGNTERFATEIRDALRVAGASVAVSDISLVRPADLAGIDLLVVGAPTHACPMSRASTREEAMRRGAEADRSVLGTREWLGLLDDAFPTRADRPLTAVFDSRMRPLGRLPGSAAQRAARALRAQGFHIAAEPRSFFVEERTGPPSKAELERAREWAALLPSLHAGRGSLVSGAS